MKPDYRILADKEDVTAVIRSRLLSLSVTDEAGLSSDALEIALDDRLPEIAMPRSGAELAVSLGYAGTGLALMGKYVVDEVEVDGPPRTMTIKARAADLRQGMKSPKTRAWEQMTIGGLVAAIAAEHGYQPAVADRLAAVLIPHLDQTGESDLHLLTRLAETHGAIAKPAGGFLLFVPQGESKSLTGKAMPVINVAGRDLSRYRLLAADRGKYASVIAHWYDAAAAQPVAVRAGDGDPAFTIRQQYPDAATATAAAIARLAAFNRGKATVSFTLPGDNRLAAEGRLIVGGCRGGVDGEWLLTRVRHAITGSGYVCEIEGETP